MIQTETYESPLAIESIEPIVLRIPLDEPVRTPMGMADSAIALLVRVTTTAGEQGWGEIWCNFPRFGAFHRATIVKRVLEPFLKSRQFSGPYDAWSAMNAAVNVLRLQSGEPGPLAAAIAGIDIALWDIVGQREKKPLWELFGGRNGTITVYGSLGRSHGCEPLIETGMKRGFRGFKLRVWGNVHDHLHAYEKARALIGPDMELMADGNSSWPLDQAVAWSKAFARVRLSFLEEPIPVDSPLEVWQQLAAEAPMKIAGGENMISLQEFDAAIASRVYGVLQPDMSKWGGFSGGVPLARRIVDAGIRFCPHMFSAAPGLLASAHLLAAANSPDGSLEWGIEYNPTRDDFVTHQIRNGVIDIGGAAGLGLQIDEEKLRRYRVAID